MAILNNIRNILKCCEIYMTAARISLGSQTTYTSICCSPPKKQTYIRFVQKWRRIESEVVALLHRVLLNFAER